MAGEQGADFNVGHPAPDRGRIRPPVLAFGLFGAPVAWSAQLLANSAVAGIVCAAGDSSARAAGGSSWLGPAMISINLFGLLVCAFALLAAWRSYRRTGTGSSNQHDAVMDAGEGRGRFLAIWAVWTAILFFLAIAFNTLSVFRVGLCAA
jgi:hypothetical protein